MCVTSLTDEGVANQGLSRIGRLRNLWLPAEDNVRVLAASKWRVSAVLGRIPVDIDGRHFFFFGLYCAVTLSAIEGLVLELAKLAPGIDHVLARRPLTVLQLLCEVELYAIFFNDRFLHLNRRHNANLRLILLLYLVFYRV